MNIFPLKRILWFGLLIAASYRLGSANCKLKWDRAQMASQQSAAHRHAKQDAVSVQSEQDYLSTQAQLQAFFQDQLFTELLYAKADPDFARPVPPHFIRLWNNHNRAQLPQSAARPDART